MRLFIAFLLISLALVPAASADDIIVGFNGSDRSAHRSVGGQVVGDISRLNADVVSVPNGKAKAFINSYRARSGVRFAEEDTEARALTNDTYFFRQWHLDNSAATVQSDSTFSFDADVDQPEAWTAAGTLPTVKVAVLDTGIDQDHPDLPVLGAQKNFSNSKKIDDMYGHGTHVAGIIAARSDNNLGVSGIARNVQLLNGKVLGDNGSGSCSAIANGIIWAADQGANIISMSLGGGACSSEQQAINYAWGKGSLIVAAAGNSSTNAYSYPAAYYPTLAVASTDNSDNLSSFSNYGSWVEIAAPGTSIYSTMTNHRSTIGGSSYGYLSGTSMATPLVAGAAALPQISDSNGNGRTNDELRARLVASADRPSSVTSVINGGRLNACRAVTGLSSC